jgi:hypothetical protein
MDFEHSDIKRILNSFFVLSCLEWDNCHLCSSLWGQCGGGLPPAGQRGQYGGCWSGAMNESLYLLRKVDCLHLWKGWSTLYYFSLTKLVLWLVVLKSCTWKRTNFRSRCTLNQIIYYLNISQYRSCCHEIVWVRSPPCVHYFGSWEGGLLPSWERGQLGVS